MRYLTVVSRIVARGKEGDMEHLQVQTMIPRLKL